MNTLFSHIIILKYRKNPSLFFNEIQIKPIKYETYKQIISNYR